MKEKYNKLHNHAEMYDLFYCNAIGKTRPTHLKK